MPAICQPFLKFDEELSRATSKAQHIGNSYSRKEFKPVLNAAAILERGNASYAFMSTPGGNAASELGARMPPNGRFKLKVRIGRDPICISGKCGCESPLSGGNKMLGKSDCKNRHFF